MIYEQPKTVCKINLKMSSTREIYYTQTTFWTLVNSWKIEKEKTKEKDIKEGSARFTPT